MLIFIAYINPRKRHQNSLRRNVGIVCYYYELVTSYSLSSPVQSHPLSFCLHFILRDSMVLFQASSGKNCEYRAVSIGNRTTCCSFSKCYLHEKNSKDSHDRYRQSPNRLSKELLLNPVISKLGKQVVLLLINSFSSSVSRCLVFKLERFILIDIANQSFTTNKRSLVVISSIQMKPQFCQEEEHRHQNLI